LNNRERSNELFLIVFEKLMNMYDLSNELNNTTGFLDLLLGKTRDETSTDNDGLRDLTLGQDLTITLIIYT
jgi:hypothetical protein